MESGWRHEDHQSQREFERLQPKKAAAQGSQVEVAGATPTPGTSRVQSSLEFIVESPLETIDVSKSNRTGKVVYSIERRLSVYHEDVPVYTHYNGTQHEDVQIIDFRAGANISLETWRHTDGHIAVEITSTASGGGSYSWFLDDAFSASTEISNTETVTFTGTGVATVIRTGNTINIDVPTPPSYLWYVDTNSSGSYTVTSGTVLNFVDGAGITITRSGVDITIASSGAAYDWDIHADANPLHTVTTGTTVQLVSGSNISLSQTGGVITIAANAYPDYNWYASDSITSTNVTDGNTVTWIGSGALTVVNTAGTFTIARPLTIEDDNVAVGGTDTAFINFDSNGSTTTGQAVNFVVTDDGSGQRSIKAYVPASGGSYQWNFSVNGGAVESVDNADTLDFSAVNGTIVLARTGLNATIKSPFTIEDDNVAVGGDDTVTLNFDSNGQTTTAVAVNFVVTDDGGGQRSIKGYVPSGGGAYDWKASDGGSPDTIASGETVTWSGGTGISVSYNAGINTFTITNTAPHVAYSWTIAAEDTAGTSTISNGDTVTFIGGSGVLVTRSGDNIQIDFDYTDPPWSDALPKRRMTGEIVFDPTDPDYIALEVYHYGYRQYQDIVHNWNLSNLNDYHLELVDKNLNDIAVLTYYRDGTLSLAGEDLDPQPFRNKPHWAALDRNTIRVWATMSRLKHLTIPPAVPTEMRFRYVLTEE